eukprot:4821024-Pleurochrysis_carterae.AAC.3
MGVRASLRSFLRISLWVVGPIFDPAANEVPSFGSETQEVGEALSRHLVRWLTGSRNGNEAD